MRVTSILPPSKVERVSIYVGNCRETLEEVKRRTGADYVINGGLYDMGSGEALCHLKADGKVYATDAYSYWGYGWTDSLPALTSSEDGLDNYICCVCLVRKGKRERLIVSDGLNGARARTAMGRMPDGGLLLYCTTEPTTPEGLQEEMLRLGVDSAVMLDGGGSTQCDMAGEVISSARRVHNYICVTLKSGSKPESTPTSGKVYRVQVGAFSQKVNADALCEELKGRGYAAFVTESEGD